MTTSPTLEQLAESEPPFGRSVDRYAVEHGLKKRESDEVMKEYVKDVRPTMRAVGLQFPPAEQIGFELPADLDLTV